MASTPIAIPAIAPPDMPFLWVGSVALEIPAAPADEVALLDALPVLPVLFALPMLAPAKLRGEVGVPLRKELATLAALAATLATLAALAATLATLTALAAALAAALLETAATAEEADPQEVALIEMPTLAQS